MNWTRTRNTLGIAIGVLSITSSGILVWYAFEIQMCTMSAGVRTQCSPNVAYLVPGILAALIGIVLIVSAYRRNRLITVAK